MGGTAPVTEDRMAEKKVCPACGQIIKDKKSGLLLPSIIGTVIGVLVAVIFNNYYFAGSGFTDPMPLTHLIAGFILGATGGMIFGLATRNR